MSMAEKQVTEMSNLIHFLYTVLLQQGFSTILRQNLKISYELNLLRKHYAKPKKKIVSVYSFKCSLT